MSLYRNMIRQAWNTTWSNKYLWFFGLFAALVSSGGEYEILVRGLGTDAGGDPGGLNRIRETGIFSKQALVNLGDILKNDTSSFVIALIVGLLILALSLFLIWLAVVSQAALVNNVAGHLGGKAGDFKGGMVAGMKKFWPVLGLNAISKAVVYLIFIIFGLPVIYTASKAGLVMANLLYVLLFIIFVIVVLTLSFIIKYAIGYTVIKGSKILESIKSGWNLFAKNWLVSMEMALLLFFVSLVVSFAYFLVMLVFAIPFMLLIFAFAKISTLAFMFVITMALIFYFATLVLVGSTLSTFQVASWTALFLQLAEKGAESKLVRVINGLLDK